MATNSLSLPASEDRNPLGTYLKNCRSRLDPLKFGFSASRRRTPGLRREEVAQLADVSATWYTWLEQGRGGVPSTDVLDRIAKAMGLTAVEREYLFLVAQHRPPEVRYQAPEITPKLQRVLDSMEDAPALIKTAMWDVVAWNRAAELVLASYPDMPLAERNIVRMIFCDSRVRESLPNWERDARNVVAAFRTETARACASKRAKALVTEISRLSPEFREIWREHDVRTHGGETKAIIRPPVGLIELEYSSFAVDGQPNLGLIVYSPASPLDAEKVRTLMQAGTFANR